MPQMPDESDGAGRKTSAVAVLQKLYENQTVNDVKNDTAAHFAHKSGPFAVTGEKF